MLCWNYWFIFNKLFIHNTNSSRIMQMTILRGGCGRIMWQLGNIENDTIFFLKFYILKSNLSLTHIKFVYGCRLRDFWYEAQKKEKKYARDNDLQGWNDVVVYRDFRPPYILEYIWAYYIQHVTSEQFTRRS
jgi:hypothetical protein